MRLLVFLAVLWSPLPATAATFTVNNTGDAPDVKPGDGICRTVAKVCTLRAAIEEANRTAGPDNIHFSIPGCAPVCTIQPQSPLPPLEDPATTLDGTTQTQSQGNTNAAGPEIELTGTALLPLLRSDSIGLRLLAGLHTIKGLTINSFTTGILIARAPMAVLESAAVQVGGNVISDNYVGTEPNGTVGKPGWDGVVIEDESAFYGGTENRVFNNVLSGNANCALTIRREGTDRNHVYANRVGTDPTGAFAVVSPAPVLIPQYCGILIERGAKENHIGPDNLISGNLRVGVWLNGEETNGNTVDSNRIGTNLAGDVAIRNGTGIAVSKDASRNHLLSNLIAGNRTGVAITGQNTRFNELFKNRIGIVPLGAVRSPANEIGVSIAAASNTVVGSVNVRGENVVSGNASHGIRIDYADDTEIVGNRIGTDPTGTSAIGNGTAKGGSGIYIDGRSSRTIIRDNVISGNHGAGIEVVVGPSTTISLNKIGTDANATVAIPNQVDGLVAGGNVEALDNTIAGNNGSGVVLSGSENRLVGNRIGVAGLGNTGAGVTVEDGADNVIGRLNVITANGGDGIEVLGRDDDRNLMLGNEIYANGGIGIDLGPHDGVTPNDPQDPDWGANDELNHPENLQFPKGLGNSVVVGTAAPRGLVQVFKSDGDASGHGEGRELLASGVADVNGRFQIKLAGGGLNSGDVITATVTTTVGTSEFSPNLRVP